MLIPGSYLINRYEIIMKIGSGGMADVYKAKDHVLNRLVAIKVLKQEYSTDATFVKKFRVEAQSAAGLSHPNIVNVYDVGEDDGVYFIVMELVQGITLKNYIDMKGKLDIREALNISVQIASGLSAAHENRIIHRDIKTSNIIISSDMQVTLIDFNASKKFDSGKNYDTCLMGTAEYAAPEQFGFSQSDARTDIYALGILLNILITGCFPKDVLCSGSAARVVTKCTQMDPARRYSSVLQLKSALRYISDTPVKHLYPFLPPGFRTMTWWKIIIALIMYPLLATLCLSLDLTRHEQEIPHFYKWWDEL